MPPFTKVLVANRGEIAVRIFRTLRELEVATVAVYSEPDRRALHVSSADEAFLIGTGPASDSYLRADRIIDAAERAGAEAIHPGYGFLAENAAFAAPGEPNPASCGSAPRPKRSTRWDRRSPPGSGCKRLESRSCPARRNRPRPRTRFSRIATEIGYPIAIKASAGGGGKGLRIAHAPDEVERAYDAARREGEAYFADSAVYVERYLHDPRHVEVQILADAHGAVVHLGERDCTIQRRHQKLVEETPSPAVDAELRARIGSIAVEAARAVDYRSAGTIEGLLTPDGSYYFLEMNTRIQVEHTVTEAVTGIDLVREQILIAAGEPLSFTQEDVSLRGHAIECRINAEDVARGFLPTPGRIEAYREPGGIGVRVDSGVRAGDEISDLYDPLIAKLIVHDTDRERARRRALRALEEFVVAGPTTLIAFHRALLSSRCFVAGETCSGLVESEELAKRAQELGDSQLPHEQTTIGNASDGASPATRARVLEVELDGRRHEVRLHAPEPAWAEAARRHKERSKGLGGEAEWRHRQSDAGDDPRGGSRRR